MRTTSSELLAREMGLGPICDACLTPLAEHGATAAGQACDMRRAIYDLWRPLLEAVERIPMLGGDR